jgi:hypothetical protein
MLTVHETLFRNPELMFSMGYLASTLQFNETTVVVQSTGFKCHLKPGSNTYVLCYLVTQVNYQPIPAELWSSVKGK